MYNGVNSSIDAVRGKHDIMGSMAAGAVTGALFRSTGMSFYIRIYKGATTFSHLCLLFVSWHQTGRRCCDDSVRYGRTLELCEKERLIPLSLYVYTTLIHPPQPGSPILADL